MPRRYWAFEIRIIEEITGRRGEVIEIKRGRTSKKIKRKRGGRSAAQKASWNWSSQIGKIEIRRGAVN